MTAEALLWGLLAIASVVASAIISGFEIGFYSVNRLRLELRVARVPPDDSARLLRAELDHPSRTLSTLLIANNLVGYVSSLALTNALATTQLSEGALTLVNVAILAPVLFLFGEALPKELFRVEADRLTYFFVRPVSWTRRFLTLLGILPLIRLCVTLLEKSAGLTAEAVADARQRLLLQIKEGVVAGTLSESQSSLVERAMRFGTLTVGAEMTPWSAVRPIPHSADRAMALRIIGDLVHARFPVVDRYGRFTGTIKLIDLHLNPHATVAELTLPAPRVHAEMPLHDAILRLREASSRFAVVEDSSGRPIGVITSKDLVEPLTGELPEY